MVITVFSSLATCQETHAGEEPNRKRSMADVEPEGTLGETSAKKRKSFRIRFPGVLNTEGKGPGEVQCPNTGSEEASKPGCENIDVMVQFS